MPYLEATYSQEAGALCDWIEEHGGIRLPFAELAGDPRTTARGGYLRGGALFRMEGALEGLARQVRQGASVPGRRTSHASSGRHRSP